MKNIGAGQIVVVVSMKIKSPIGKCFDDFFAEIVSFIGIKSEKAAGMLERADGISGAKRRGRSMSS